MFIDGQARARPRRPAPAEDRVVHPRSREALGLVDQHLYEVALFHAERHTYGSNFKLTLTGFVKKLSDVHGGLRRRHEDALRAVRQGHDEHQLRRVRLVHASCKLGPYCGDKTTTNPPEECDDGSNLTSYSAIVVDRVWPELQDAGVLR